MARFTHNCVFAIEGSPTYIHLCSNLCSIKLLLRKYLIIKMTSSVYICKATSNNDFVILIFYYFCTGYQPPSLPKNAGIHEFQIVAFRHNTTLRVPFPEVHDVERRAFSMRHWLDEVYNRVKLCGPVAGIQIRTQYQEPLGVPSVPYVPPGAAPGMQPPAYPVPPPAYPPLNQPPAYPNQPNNYPQPPPAYVPPYNHQTPPKTKGNASLAKPASIIILSLVIFVSVLI